jgi:hypothetical protein
VLDRFRTPEAFRPLSLRELFLAFGYRHRGLAGRATFRKKSDSELVFHFVPEGSIEVVIGPVGAFITLVVKPEAEPARARDVHMPLDGSVETVVAAMWAAMDDVVSELGWQPFPQHS